MKKLNLNNLKIRTKLLLIYTFCVLLPIFLTDAVILVTVSQNAKESQKREINQVVERVGYNLNDVVERCILFSSNLYNDTMLDEYLNKKYNTILEYYQYYRRMLTYNNLSYNNNYGIQYIQIYADNDTILNGGRIGTVEWVKDTDWYQAFKESDKDIFLYIYYDESKKLIAGSGPSRTISMIRKLDNFAKNGIEKFVKIDIDYNIMLKDVMNEKIDGQIYVRNKDYILFSNVPNESGMREYLPISTIDDKKVTMTRNFKAINQEWEIVIETKNIPFWTTIVEYEGLLLLILLNIIIPTVMIYFVGRSISKRLSIVSTYMGKVKKEQFEAITYQEGEDEIGNLIRSYNLMVLKIKDLIEVVFKGNAEKQALELSKKQAELQAIQSQVNPHFLFNTLESIRMRSLLKSEDETANIIGELAILFRKSMSWTSDFITIEEEMNFVEKYINIQKYRFGDKIKYYHYVMDGCSKFLVPKLSIVTFIENACIHGIEASVNEGVLSVTVTNNKENLFIEISDNGKGFDEQRLKEFKHMIANADSKMLYESKSTGMLNAYLRLKMYSDGNIQFDIDSALENGTDITIQIPLTYVSGILGFMEIQDEEVEG